MLTKLGGQHRSKLTKTRHIARSLSHVQPGCLTLALNTDRTAILLQVDDQDEVTIIDFPQMVSVAHPNAADLFARDVEGVMRFFKKKLGYMPEHDALLARVQPDFQASMLRNHSSP